MRRWYSERRRTIEPPKVSYKAQSTPQSTAQSKAQSTPQSKAQSICRTAMALSILPRFQN